MQLLVGKKIQDIFLIDFLNINWELLFSYQNVYFPPSNLGFFLLTFKVHIELNFSNFMRKIIIHHYEKLIFKVKISFVLNKSSFILRLIIHQCFINMENHTESQFTSS